MPVATLFPGRRVLVTGSSGFKGTWLAEWLRHLGAEVSGLALPADPAHVAGWPGLANRFPFHVADIRDPVAVSQVFATERPEIVFHLAAQPLVSVGYREPAATFATNVLGTCHVLDAALATESVRVVVVVSSDKCYENREWPWGYRETDPVGGFDPYSASKGGTELVTAAYRRSFGNGRNVWMATARAGNAIGGGDFAADRLVPDIVRAFLSGAPVTLRLPDATRPWQHVLEPLSGYLILADQLFTYGAKFAEGWNFGPSDARPLTVREIAERLGGLLGRGEIVVAPHLGLPHEAHSLRLDSAKAAAELGWRALLSPDERLRWTLDWYRSWDRDPGSVWAVARDQIAAYEGLIAEDVGLRGRWVAPEAGS